MDPERRGEDRGAKERVPLFLALHAPDDSRDLPAKGGGQTGAGDGEFLLDPRQGADGQFLEALPFVAGGWNRPEMGVLLAVPVLKEEDLHDVRHPAGGTLDTERAEVELLQLVGRCLGANAAPVEIPLGLEWPEIVPDRHIVLAPDRLELRRGVRPDDEVAANGGVERDDRAKASATVVPTLLA